MQATRVKFCGITRPEDARIAAELGADAIGLVFVPGSKRAVDLAQAEAICSVLPPMVSVVGLFMNADPDEIERACRAVPIQVLQFHGQESPEQCASFGRPWWKALPAASLDSAQYQVWSGATALVLDSHAPGAMGGSGRALDWSTLVPPPGPWILAGGLNPDNVAAAIAALAPPGLDVSSGIESAPGRKDARLMERFMNNVLEN
ncbi:MAG: phosphoribosylanthranilate isomerase [Gammaproteobacteria bacterium HGW-Gammaproteobacteria-8]|nr:MAG: phosphoribosylanthranilate isomerase [Gammaproteobacteria bacterium HGW-Gammaproteobacteria-8]